MSNGRSAALRAAARTSGAAAGLAEAFATRAVTDFVDLLPTPWALTVDVACGSGKLGALLARRGHRLLGTESLEAYAYPARATCHYDAVQRAAPDRLPLKAGAADLVVVYLSFDRVRDLDAAVAGAARILRPGGHLALAYLSGFGAAARSAGPVTMTGAVTVPHGTVWATLHPAHRSREAHLQATHWEGLGVRSAPPPRPAGVLPAVGHLLAHKPR
jgi:SAM-dependent methyltransferase